MQREYLYCVSKESTIDGKDGIIYKCIKDTKKISPIINTVKCVVCDKEYKDERSLKIHKTKMQHWIKETNKKRQDFSKSISDEKNKRPK